MEASKAEGSAVPVAEPVMIVLERAGDGTWTATPEYGDEDVEHAPSCAGVPDGGDDLLEHVVTAGSRAHAIMLAKWALACTITDFNNDIREFIEEYFNPSVDRGVQLERLHALFSGQGDERARDMLLLLRDGLDGDEPPAEDEEPDHHQQADGGDEGLVFAEKPVSAAGFVDRLHMRKCIKAFLDPDIDVYGEDKDTDCARHLWANFMSATRFVNRLWDVRRIIDVFVERGLDKETRRAAAIVKMIGELEMLLMGRATAVATGRFNLF